MKEKSRHPFVLHLRVIALAGVMLFTSVSLQSHTSISDPVSGVSELGDIISIDVRQSIVQFASKYIGTPYHFGGCSPKGFDCSGFTSYVMREFGLSLPRTSCNQSVLGRAISLKHAQPGDLLFFGRGKHIEHVAIVVSNHKDKLEMVHSSTSHGVMIEDMWDSCYWKKRIMFAVDLASL